MRDNCEATSDLHVNKALWTLERMVSATIYQPFTGANSLAEPRRTR
jgi:hypothetical protein